ncbi:hypothetical protein BRL73_11720, partial [Xanthomonas oryzae pv. oryzae]
MEPYRARRYTAAIQRGAHHALAISAYGTGCAGAGLQHAARVVAGSFAAGGVAATAAVDARL